ncbi:hypothetical protein M9Y10_012934 [Tritrichomonas musculus]|uniref:Viral A-type inclusion protein n=1 Tax=Tritrichomonas musculus TaxID=1915356 RepID=A0ABR2I5P1_9EUKA
MEEETHSGDSESFLISTIQNFTTEEQNEQLKKEVIMLKAQFEEAVQIHTTIDKIKDENAKLTKQILDLTNEKEEMTRRLEIAVKANADLSESLENQKKQYSLHVQNEGNNVQVEKSKIAQAFQSQIESLEEQLSEMGNEYNDLKLAQKVLASQIQRALEAAGFYFKITFSNLDDMITFFQKEPIPIKTESNNNNTQNDNKNINITQINPNVGLESDNKEKLKALKKKLKTRSSEYKSLSDELDRVQSAHKREIASYQSQIDHLRKEMNERDHTAKESIRNLQSTVNRLNQEINSSRDTISVLKVKNNELKYANRSQSALLDHSISSAIEPIKETKVEFKKDFDHKKSSNEKALLKDEIDHLHEKIADLTQKQLSAERKSKTIEDQLRSKENQLQNEQIKYQKIENELNSLKVIHSEIKSENDALRKTLHEKGNSSPKYKEQKHIFLEKQSKILEKKDDEIAQLHLEIKQAELHSTEQSLVIVDLKNQVSSLEDELQKLKVTYNDYVVKMEGTYIPTVDDFLPPSAFKTKYFEPALSNDIMKIATNTALQAPSKIEFIFRAIYNYYNKKIGEFQEKCDSYFQNESIIRNRINQFIIDVSIALNDQNPMTFDDLFNNCDKSQDCCKLIIDLITDCKAKFVSATRERDQLISVLTNIGQIANFNNANGYSSNFCELIPIINEMKNELIAAQNGFQQISKKYKSYYSESKALLKKCKLNEAKNKQEIMSLQSKNSELEHQINDKSSHISQLKKENKQLHTDLQNTNLSEVSTTQFLKREDISFNSNEEVETMKNKFTSAVESYKAHIQHLEKKNDDLTKQIKKIENELAKSQQIISTQKNSNDQLAQENIKLTQQNSQIESVISTKYETAKNNLQKSFDQTIEQIKQQNEQSRNDLQKVIKQLKMKDEKIKELNMNIKTLINEKNKLSNEANAIKEQLERERLIIDASVKTQILTIESKYKEQMDKQIAHNEAEQRNIIMFAVNAFRTIVSPASTMGVSGSSNDNVKLYKNLIEKIKDIVTKLSESDQAIRKMLCAYNHQTTQDAVAQLLYNSNTN